MTKFWYSSLLLTHYISLAITIQRLVDDWILKDSGASVTVAQSGAVFLPFPTKEYTRSGFYQTIGPFAPLLFTLGLLYPVSSTIRSIVLEKELRQKELMKMMSVTELDIGWSWFTSFYAFFAPCGVLTGKTKYDVLLHTHMFIAVIYYSQLTLTLYTLPHIYYICNNCMVT